MIENMKETEILRGLLDSWNEPLVLVDTEHTILYMNAPAKTRYAEWGNVIGKNIFLCHNDKSSRIIRGVFKKLQDGHEEVLFADKEGRRAYMRGLRDEDGKLLGYYARSEPSPEK
jgi:DUF438 domain-containing protein